MPSLLWVAGWLYEFLHSHLVCSGTCWPLSLDTSSPPIGHWMSPPLSHQLHTPSQSQSLALPTHSPDHSQLLLLWACLGWKAMNTKRWMDNYVPWALGATEASHSVHSWEGSQPVLVWGDKSLDLGWRAHSSSLTKLLAEGFIALLVGLSITW